MAIYHFSAQVISRSAGRSSVAAAAYRAGEQLTDERTGITYDFTRRRLDIETEILAPANAPEWAYNREALWNAVEAAERRSDAQLCREINIALPRELTREQAKALVRAYVQDQFVSRGMIADVAYHWDRHNPHIHVMLTLRSIGPDGFGRKVREWNDRKLLQEWREQWAVYANRALERAGSRERIDHRTLAAQGINRMPQIHLGPHVAAMEKRGKRTDRGDTLRYIRQLNGVVIDLERAKAEFEALRQARERLIRNGVPSSIRQMPEWVQAELWVGREIRPEELPRLMQEVENKLVKARGALAPLLHERERLRTAADLLARRDQLTERIKGLEKPAEVLRRAVSGAARREYQQLRVQLQQVERDLHRLGVLDRQDYERQSRQFEKNHGEQVRMLTQEVHQASKTAAALSAAAGLLRRLRGQEHVRNRERRKEELELEEGYGR